MIITDKISGYSRLLANISQHFSSKRWAFKSSFGTKMVGSTGDMNQNVHPNGSLKNGNGSIEEKLDELRRLMGKVEGDPLRIVGVGAGAWFDLPQALEDEYGGWVNRDIIKDFRDYADACFREFGDRVKYWNTVNEPNVFAIGGYDQGAVPPQRCSPPFGFMNCTKGNSRTEPYLVVHHILLAHSSAVRLYRRKYRSKQQGFVGISVYTFGFLPQTNTEEDVLAVKRARDFLVGWVLEPLVNGDYPSSMKTRAGARIPAFTARESRQVKGSSDFIGLIYYTISNISDNQDSLKQKSRDFGKDMAADILGTKSLFTAEEFPIAPWGLQQVLETFKVLYGNPPIFIYENGQKTARNISLEDVSRVKYLQAHIGGVLDALRNGSNTRGYFAWSFLDLLELLDGYKSAFGLYYVDLDDPHLTRYPKLSAKWYSQFLMGRKTSSIVAPVQFPSSS